MSNHPPEENRRFAPAGVVKAHRVQMGLMPAELAEHKAMAAMAKRSDAALARDIYLLGLPIYRARHAKHAARRSKKA